MEKVNEGVDGRKNGKLWESIQCEDDATRSRIEAGWHPSLEGARRRKRKRRMKRSRNTTCWDCCIIIHKTCLWIGMQHHFFAIKIVGSRELSGWSGRRRQEVGMEEKGKLYRLSSTTSCGGGGVYLPFVLALLRSTTRRPWSTVDWPGIQG